MAWRTTLASPTPRLKKAQCCLPHLPQIPGTYALALNLDSHHTCCIGALGTHTLRPGLYVYTGSAWGPGGLAARLNRHLQGSSTLHWHIDYLRQIAQPVAVWIAPHTHVECAWAHALQAYPQAMTPVSGFGASDCSCNSHLTYFSRYNTENISLPGNPEFIILL